MSPSTYVCIRCRIEEKGQGYKLVAVHMYAHTTTHTMEMWQFKTEAGIKLVNIDTTM